MATQQQKPAPFGARSFFDPNQGALQPTPDQNQPQNLQPNTALPAANDSSSAPQMASNSGAAALPSMTPPATAPAGSAPATSNSPGTSTDDGANYLFHQVSPTAFLPARPVSPLDEVHGVRRGFAMALAGLGDFGSRLTGRNDSLLQDWNKEHMAQVQYDRNQPQMSARAQMQSDQSNLANQGAAAGVAHTQAETGLTQQQTDNLRLNPPGKADFLKELQTRRATGEDDPQQLAQEYLARAPYSHVTRGEVMNIINSTPEQPPAAKIGPQGIAEPVKYHGRVWNGREPDAPPNVQAAFTTAKPVENTIHQNKLQEQAASRQNIVLKNDLANGPFGSYNVPSGATGEQALASVDPATAASVRMLGDGKADFQTFASRMSPTAKNNLAALVHAYNPNFDQSTFAIRKGMGEYMTSGAGGDQLQMFHTAIDHMKTFNDLSKALNNGDVQSLSKVGNWIGTQFGSDKATNFNIAKQAFLGEVGKAFAGANVAEGDRKSLVESVQSANSPDQLAGAAKTALALLQGKEKHLESRANAGLNGKADFGGNGGSQQQSSIPVGATAKHQDGTRWKFNGGDPSNMTNWSQVK